MANAACDLHNNDVPGVLLCDSIPEFIDAWCCKLYRACLRTLLSAYVIREAVGPTGWLGVLVGFTGVIVLLQPGSDDFSP